MKNTRSRRTLLIVLVRLLGSFGRASAAETGVRTAALGSLRLKYAAGEDWLGEEALFGPATICNKALRRFDFERQGRQTGGYVVELILQPDGNLPTAAIPKSEW